MFYLILSLFCLLLGVVSIAVSRRIPYSQPQPNVPPSARDEWLSLARAGSTMLGATLLLAGIIFLLVGGLAR